MGCNRQLTILNCPSYSMITCKKSIAALFLAVVLWTIHGACAATYEVGPSLTYTNLGQVPWTALAAGDTVNIHFKPGGYHEVILLSNSGTSNAPITINGIPDPQTGALPLLDGSNAVTAVSTPWRSLTYNTEGVIVISRAAGTAFGYIPSWIVIQNLHVQNADPGHSVQQSNGTTNAFDTSAAGISMAVAAASTVHPWTTPSRSFRPMS